MQVILLDKVNNLGKLGDKVKVRPGYGRNYLIPYGKAVSATGRNLELFEQRRAEFEKAAQDALSAAQVRADKLKDIIITIAANAGDEGKLFGSVGTKDISNAITAQSGVTVTKSEILLPDGVIRQTGEYAIGVILHSDIRIDVKITVVGEK